MNTSKTALLLAACAAAALSAPSEAAVISISLSTPTVDGEDQANLVYDGNGTRDKAGKNAGLSGQTFTVGANAAFLTSFSFLMQSTTTGGVDEQYTIRVGTITAGVFTALHSENAVQLADTLPDDWFTITFDTPVALSANTVYGVDIDMTNTDGSGIPYFRVNKPDAYAGGDAYLPTDGTPNTANVKTDRDFVFHANLEVPEPASLALLGIGGLLIARRR